ncbi:MAG: N-acetylmuramoyl-L-alanine amidase [Candidatus Omnitrophota bacterium]
MINSQIQRLAGFFILGFILAGCATAPVRPAMEEFSLKDLCDQNNIEWNLDSVSQVVTLNRGGMTAKVLLGSNLVMVDGEKFILGGSVRRQHGSVIVPFDFKSKIIDRLVAETEYPIKKFRRILIDPGHGGKDPGAIGATGLKEKVVVLDIARKLKRTLEKHGIKAVMTRDKDEFISLARRAEIAQEIKADLFVSVHANASRSRSSHGFEVYYLRELDYKAKRDIQAVKNYEELFKHFEMKRSIPALKEILIDMLYSHKQGESRKLANYIAKNTSDNANSKDRGSHSAGFFVLKNTIIPAVLVEVGFVSNRQEEQLLKTSSHRQKIAEGIAKSILEYASD